MVNFSAPPSDIAKIKLGSPAMFAGDALVKNAAVVVAARRTFCAASDAHRTALSDTLKKTDSRGVVSDE
jgi:hypothetical protein